MVVKGGGVSSKIYIQYYAKKTSQMYLAPKKYYFAEFGGKTGSTSVGMFASLVAWFVFYAASQWNWTGLFF